MPVMKGLLLPSAIAFFVALSSCKNAETPDT